MNMTTKANILVTYVMPYNINENGRETKGCSVQFFFWGENGEPFEAKDEYISGIENAVGVQRAKLTVDYEKRKKIRRVPAVYEAELMMTVGSNGKPTSKLLDIEYIAPIHIEMAAASSEIPFEDVKMDKPKK